MSRDIHKKKHLSSFQLIILGFAGVILFGAIILMLPVSSAEGVMTPFNQTLFTSTSAVCVTGLAVLDTGSYWSVFGQVVILLLIQIGGLGVVTVAVSVFMLSGRKISLMQRSTMQNAISAHKVGGIVRLTKFILKGTLFVEMAGALALLPVFYHDFGRKGIWMAVFHSISAFCNAGFDILGTPENPFPSITAYAGNPIVNVVIMFLIIAGGIGFLTWEDICINKIHFRKYHMQSKIILVTTALLIVLPAVFFFFSDFTHLSVGKRLLASAFQAVTPRTALKILTHTIFKNSCFANIDNFILGIMHQINSWLCRKFFQLFLNIKHNLLFLFYFLTVFLFGNFLCILTFRIF